MPRTRDDAQYEANIEKIKAIAHAQMEAEGTNAVSLRGIAREMGMTPNALYVYFPTRNDIITALILEAFHGLADALEAARDATAGTATEKLWAVIMMYRQWCIANATRFMLIYGTPIHGYDAPAEITIPAAARGFGIVLDLMAAAIENGECVPPQDSYVIPTSIVEHLTALQERDGYMEPPLVALYYTVKGWTQIHGIVSLEILDHLPPVIGDVEAFYQDQMRGFFRDLGFKI